MTKGEKLIWDLFMKLREVLPATPDNTAWGTEWARVFHEMEHPEPADLPDDEMLDNAGEREIADPHEHGVPARPAAGTRMRKKK